MDLHDNREPHGSQATEGRFGPSGPQATRDTRVPNGSREPDGPRTTREPRGNRASARTNHSHGVALAFLVVAFALMLIPSVGMVWAPTTSTTENRQLASEPQLCNDDGTFNVNILSDAGTYFEDHYALRNQMVSLNSSMHAALGTSSIDQVVVGRDGWLYYNGSLYDYLGMNQLSDRQLENIAHNLSLAQWYTQRNGATFVFTVAPNKNSLYPEYMPLYYAKSPEASNWERLKPYLDAYGVNYVDLFELFETADASDPLYYQRDTHWNNEGALLAGNAILESLGHQTVSVADDAWTTRDDYTGDLAGMLYPANTPVEQGVYASGINDGEGLSGSEWTYTQGSAVTDNVVETRSATGANAAAGTDTATSDDATDADAATGGTLVMYRDSFGNALIPYFSCAFDNAYFSKLIPYDATQVDARQATCVVVERAERHLDYLATHPVIMTCPQVRMGDALPDADTSDAAGTTFTLSTDGSYIVASGILDSHAAGPGTRIYVELDRDDGTRTTFEAFDISTDSTSANAVADTADGQQTTSVIPAEATEASATPVSDYAYQAYLPASALDGVHTVRILAGTSPTSVTSVKTFTVE